MATKDIITPKVATHPGDLIKDELDAVGMRQKELAQKMEVKPSFLNEIIKGKRPVSAKTAVLLEENLGIPAEYWMRLQSQYDVDAIRVEKRNQRQELDNKEWDIIKDNICLPVFRSLGYIGKSVRDNIRMIKSIYDVQTIDDLLSVVNCSSPSLSFYRKSDKMKIDESYTSAWRQIAFYEGRKQEVGTYREENIESLIAELNLIFFENSNTVVKTKEVLNRYGIKFIVLGRVENAPIDGFSFWSVNNPAIALTLRKKTIDNFAFTLLHEIGHIKSHLLCNKERQYVNINGMDKNCKEEREADKFAADSLISPAVWKTLKPQRLTQKLVLNSLALELGIHPAIIFGRMCNDTGKYNYKTKLDRKLY